MGKMGFPGATHMLFFVALQNSTGVCVQQITLHRARTNSLFLAYVISLCQKELLCNSCIWFTLTAVWREFHNTLLLTLESETSL